MGNEVMTPEQVEAELLAFEEMELETVAIIKQHSQRNELVVCRYHRGPSRNLPTHFVIKKSKAENMNVVIVTTVKNDEEGKRMTSLLDSVFDAGMSYQRGLIWDFMKSHEKE